MLKYERGRVQTDGEYKLLILLIYLSRTMETIKSHMHHAGLHEIQIPEYGSVTYLNLIAANLQYLDWVNRNSGLRSLPMSLPSIVQAGRPPTRSVLKYNMFASNVLRILHRWCRTIA